MDSNILIFVLIAVIIGLIISRIDQASKKREALNEVKRLKLYELFVQKSSKAIDGKKVDFSDINLDEICISNGKKLVFHMGLIYIKSAVSNLMFSAELDSKTGDISKQVLNIRVKIYELKGTIGVVNFFMNRPFSRDNSEELLDELDVFRKQGLINEIKGMLKDEKEIESIANLMIDHKITLEELKFLSGSLNFGKLKEAFDLKTYAKDISVNSTKKKNSEEQK